MLLFGQKRAPRQRDEPLVESGPRTGGGSRQAAAVRVSTPNDGRTAKATHAIAPTRPVKPEGELSPAHLLAPAQTHQAITGPGDVFNFQPDIYNHLVITMTGTVFRSQASHLDSSIGAQVDAAIAQYNRRTISDPLLPQLQKREHVVPIGYLRGIRHRDSTSNSVIARHAAPIDRGRNTQQEHVAEWVREAVRLGCSDLEYKFRGGRGELRAKCHGAMTKILEKIEDPEYATSIMPATWNLAAHSGDVGAYNEYTNQGRRIPGTAFPDVPEGYTLDGIRLTYLRYNTEPHASVMFVRLFARVGDGLKSLTSQGWDKDAHVPLWSRIESLSGGLVVLSGEVGDGKSTTSATVLRNRYHRRDETDNMITVEDIIELPLPFAHQIQLSATSDGTSLEDQLDNLLGYVYRANPTTLMVNEAKNRSIFSGIVRCMLNGSTAFTTAHTKHALMVPGKLRELQDNDRYLYDTETLPALTAQRLVPTVCPHCAMSMEKVTTGLSHPGQEKARTDWHALWDRIKIAYDRPPNGHMALPPLSEVMERVRFANPEGCPVCRPKITSSWSELLRGHMVGSNGRTVIGEVVLTNYKILGALHNDDVLKARKLCLDEGFTPMQRHALAKIARGEIDPREVEKRLGDLDRFHLLNSDS